MWEKVKIRSDEWAQRVQSVHHICQNQHWLWSILKTKEGVSNWLKTNSSILDLEWVGLYWRLHNHSLDQTLTQVHYLGSVILSRGSRWSIVWRGFGKSAKSSSDQEPSLLENLASNGKHQLNLSLFKGVEKDKLAFLNAKGLNYVQLCASYSWKYFCTEKQRCHFTLNNK